MPKPPVVTADQLGAAIDALATTNALMFTMLASPAQIGSAIGVFERMAAVKSNDGAPGVIRSLVAHATAEALRGLSAVAEDTFPAD